MIDTYSRILDGNATAWQLLGVHWQYEHNTDLLLYLEWSDAMKLRTALSRGVATVVEVRIRPRRQPAFTAIISLSKDGPTNERFHVAIMDTTARERDPHLALVPEPEPAPATILVVEPYAPGRRALRDSLEELGYQIVDVENREEALRVSSAISPALVISDFDQAQAESIVLLDLLRARWPGVPAILVCANPLSVTDPPRGAVLLAKPLAFEELERAIASSIGVPAPR